MHNEPTLEVVAGTIPGVIAEVEAEVKAGLIVILEVTLGVDDPGPLPDLNLGGG